MLTRRQVELGRCAWRDRGRLLEVASFVRAFLARYERLQAFDRGHIPVDLGASAHVVAERNLPRCVKLMHQDLVVVQESWADGAEILLEVARAHAAWRVEECPSEILALCVLFLPPAQTLRLRTGSLHCRARLRSPRLVPAAKPSTLARRGAGLRQADRDVRCGHLRVVSVLVKELDAVLLHGIVV